MLILKSGHLLNWHCLQTDSEFAALSMRVTAVAKYGAGKSGHPRPGGYIINC
jgi:hypothetical protein